MAEEKELRVEPIEDDGLREEGWKFMVSLWSAPSDYQDNPDWQNLLSEYAGILGLDRSCIAIVQTDALNRRALLGAGGRVVFMEKLPTQEELSKLQALRKRHKAGFYVNQG
ncbi:MAG: hypothetical protein ABIJ46_04165 [bacterium]